MLRIGAVCSETDCGTVFTGVQAAVLQRVASIITFIFGIPFVRVGGLNKIKATAVKTVTVLVHPQGLEPWTP